MTDEPTEQTLRNQLEKLRSIVVEEVNHRRNFERDFKDLFMKKLDFMNQCVESLRERIIELERMLEQKNVQN